jgi:heme exporter protein B
VIFSAGGFRGILKRDLLLAIREKSEILNTPMFFVMAITMVPLAISPSSAQLAQLAPGMIWIIALLASLLALDGLFKNDFADGSLLQLILSPGPLWILVLAKVLAHWLLTGLPITLFAPLLAVMLALPNEGYLPLTAGLAIGTACFSLIGAVGAALTVALQKGGVLLSLIVMPLYFPVLILGASTVQRAVSGLNYLPVLALLGALLAFALVTGPFAAAAALKVGVNG